MLTEVLTSILDNFHDIGHLGTYVDQMIDSVSGIGHRIEWGHDLEGLINSFQLDGIKGIGNWFDHILKDFTTESGIPLPFAEAIKNLTGMEMDEAIDWLCINAADVLELGTEVAILNLFKENPMIYKLSLLIGSALGFIDDNPLLIAYNGLKIAQELKKSGVNKNGFYSFSSNLLNKSVSIISYISIVTAITDIAGGLLHIDFAEAVGHAVDAIDLIDVVDGVDTIADIVDGFATIGLGILASRAIKSFFKGINDPKRAEVTEKSMILSTFNGLKNSARYSSPEVLSKIVKNLIERRFYPEQI